MRNIKARIRYSVILALLGTAIIWTGCTYVVLAAVYTECRQPPQIAFSTTPNLLIVMDYSGSMQYPAHIRHADHFSYGNPSRVLDDDVGNDSTDPNYITYYDDNDTERYFPTSNYFGLFETRGPSDSTSKHFYYKYDFDNGWFYSIGDVQSDGGNTGIGTIDTNPDRCVGISGNYLNFILASRMDAALMALIGGKAWNIDGINDCTDSTLSCYRKAEGCRRYTQDTHTGVDADFYVRPATYSTGNPTGTARYWPDDWTSGSYPDKDLLVTVMGHYKGKVSSNDERWCFNYAPYNESASCNRRFERWNFTLDRTTRVYIRMDPSFGGGDARIRIHDVATGTNYPNAEGTTTGPVDSAEIQMDLPPGSYKLRASSKDAGQTGNYVIYSNVTLTPDSSPCDDCTRNTIGSLPYARVRVQVAGSQRKGVVNDTWSKARYGFMYYNGVDGHEGKLLVRCGEASNVTQFGRYLEGKETSDHTPYAYEGTPTGEALREAQRYFQQSGTGINSGMHGVGTQYDPYYTWDATTSSYRPVACRKSYVVLISDGNWYYNAGGQLDPIDPANKMHTQDLRTGSDLPGSQTATVFSIWAFSPTTADDYDYGTRSMKWTALYGGHRELPNCNPGWPYNRTGLLSGRSVDTNFSITPCNTATPNACCKEWDLIRDYPATALPDNYFETRTGDQLKSAIASILEKIDQQNASSSAVATVAQQTGEGDIIIRGMFQAKPPTNYAIQDQFLWWGHLETYWPTSENLYDFQIGDGVMCKEFAAPKHCWDAAVPSVLGGPFPAAANRTIFTYKNNTKTTFNTTNITAADLGVASDTERNNIVNWVRGDEVTGKRSRRENQSPTGPQWVLGDLVYSTPVVVGAPSLGAVSDKTKALIGGTEQGIVECPNPSDPNSCSSLYFLKWRQTDSYTRDSTCTAPSWAGTPSIKFRDKVIYVGGNDGMIHAFLLSVYDRNNHVWAAAPGDVFNISDGSCSSKGGYRNSSGDCGTQTSSTDATRIAKIGTEIWAYLPSNLLTEVKDLAQETYGYEASGACSHRFMVDLAPRAWEVFFDNEATDPSKIPWHTVLIGGERGGGDMYFALDVTDPYCPKVLWEYSVLKDMVAKFDFEAATPAFRQACYNGTSISPGEMVSNCESVNNKNCCAPTLPTSWWNSHCDDCADNPDPMNCLNKLKEISSFDAVWTPFVNSTGDAMKRLPMTWSTPYMGRVKLPSGVTVNTCPPGVEGGVCNPKCSSGETAATGINNLAFIGGGLRAFDPDVWMFPTDWAAFYRDGFGHTLWKPFMLALDIRTGKNLFKYVWPEIDKAASNFFPEKKRGCDSAGENCTLRVPYAMSDPTVLDLWDSTANMPGSDGFEDILYVGDMNGIVYGIKLNLDPVDSANAGIYVDLWKTKPVPVNASTTKDRESNQYRSELQPITVQPAVSIEPPVETATSQPVRVVIGAGKYEDVSEGSKNDKTDVARMSLYNLRDVIDFAALESSDWTAAGHCNVKEGSVPFTGEGLVWRVRANCLTPDCTQSITYRCTGEGTDSGCTWSTKNLTTGATISHSGCQWWKGPNAEDSDCCQSSCTSPCWQCVFDLLDPAEKIIGKPLIAGGVVFVTSFLPTTNDPCQAGGTGFLYAFDYLCRPFPKGFMPMSADTPGLEVIPTSSGSTDTVSGARLALGLGVPSQPVLDSTGKFIIVQNSLAEMTVQGVNLPERMVQIKGWTERDQ